jgi:hypothetical protein
MLMCPDMPALLLVQAPRWASLTTRASQEAQDIDLTATVTATAATNGRQQ